MVDNNSELEKKVNIEELRKKHADVFNNPAVTAIAYWRDPLDELSAKSEKPITLSEQIDKARGMLPKLLELYEKSNNYDNKT